MFYDCTKIRYCIKTNLQQRVRELKTLQSVIKKRTNGFQIVRKENLS